MERIEPPADGAGLAEIFRKEQVDVVHQHVPGYPMPNPVYDALRLLGDQRPRLIETNVFGRREDPVGDEWVDFRCYISRASAVQAYQRGGRALDANALRRETVVFYPLPPLDPATKERRHREEIRQEMGIRPDEIFIVRFGRPGNKWNRNEVRVFQQARRKNPLLRMLLMEPRADIWREVEAGRWGEGIVLHRACSDFERLAAIYTAGDLMLHMADWGESYGYTIAEAMQQGIPLVASSTPWGDNAQVELIESGTTGFVCNSCGGAADALLRLARDAELRQRMGTAAVERISALSHLVHEADLLEEIIGHLVRGDPLTKVAERNDDLLRFHSTFAEREKNVWELEGPGLKFYYWNGAGYGLYRKLRNQASRLKRGLK